MKKFLKHLVQLFNWCVIFQMTRLIFDQGLNWLTFLLIRISNITYCVLINTVRKRRLARFLAHSTNLSTLNSITKLNTLVTNSIVLQVVHGNNICWQIFPTLWINENLWIRKILRYNYKFLKMQYQAKLELFQDIPMNKHSISIRFCIDDLWNCCHYLPIPF